MLWRSLRKCLGLAMGLMLALPGFMAMVQPVWAAEFLPVGQAFKLHAAPGPGGEVVLDFELAPQTHLYRDRLLFQGLPDTVKLRQPDLPTGKRQFDETFGKQVEIYHDHLRVLLPLATPLPMGQPAYVQVGYQGCADAGICYPPQTKYLRLTVAEGGKIAAVALASAEEARLFAPAGANRLERSPSVAAPAVAPAGSSIEHALASGNLLVIAGVFVVLGLGLAFTPCVLPMVPILSSIIVGEGQDGRIGRARGFALALSYSQGMALVYTSLGVAAGLLGEGLAATLQNPWVLGTFGVLLVLLALSMFGVYELQMPSFIQSHLTHRSGRLRGGSLPGVFVMGVLSALIVGPCVTGPLAGVLIYISQTRDVVVGGVALYSLAWGMSAPLLLVGVSAGTLLPRAGPWMDGVKTFFGMLLLGVAWWLVSPVLPPVVSLSLLGAGLALAATLLGAFDTMAPHVLFRHRAAKAAGWVLLVLAIFELVGAFSGAQEPLMPLSEIRGAGAPAGGSAQGPLAFKRVKSPAELDDALAEAAVRGQVAMVDFYADWCEACKDMERLTFTDPAVRHKLGRVALIQADVTQANALGGKGEAAKALLKRFGLFGPPGILFFDVHGQEQAAKRLIGFEKPAAFIAHLQAAGL